MASQIQKFLDIHGITLDAQSFENLCKHLRLTKLSFMLSTLLSLALGVINAKLASTYADKQKLAEQ